MSERATMSAKPESVRTSSFIPELSGLLRRKCACSASASEGECEECKKAGTLQRRSASHREPAGVPSIVREVLQVPGQALNSSVRGYMEPRFGHDFSKVRVHTDQKAAASALAVNALAYTVGRDVVFAEGQYAPETKVGQRLLAHELAHTVQNPEGTRVHNKLEVGRADDPAERAADHIADSVLRGDRVSVAPAGNGVVRRQQRTCTAAPDSSPDSRLIHCPDGEYRVTLTTTPGSSRPETHADVNPGWNNQEIWLDISVCRGGTSVEVKPSVDLPNAMVQALGNVLVGSGALAGVQLSSGVVITVVQNQSYTLTLHPNVTVDDKGVSGGGGSATVTTDKVSVSVGGTYDARNRSAVFTVTLSGGHPQPKVDCHRITRAKVVLTCERITHTPPQHEVPKLTKDDKEIRYVFFDYKTPNLRRQFRLPTDIQNLHDQGYRVTGVRGFTSPEGPREKGPNFEGNIKLGEERADSALRWLSKEACPNCDVSGVQAEGKAELPPQLGAAVPEPKGPAMERGAVAEFLGSSGTPDPLAPKDPESIAAFQKLPTSKQRDQVFELMRRAEITLEHTRVIQEHKDAVPGRDDSSKVDCPQEVTDAARTSFGISVATGLP